MPLRGVGIELTRGPTHVRAFAGAASATRGAPFFHGAEWKKAAGFLFAERSLTPELRFVSRNAISERPTSIHGLEWRPRKPWALAAAGGLGNGRPHGSSSATYEGAWLSMNAAYVGRHADFRRIDVDSPTGSEVEGANLSVSLHRADWWRVSGSHQNLVHQSGEGWTGVSVDRLGAMVNVLGFRAASSVFDARGSLRDNLGMSMMVGRRLTRSLDAVVDYFRSEEGGEPASESLVGSLQVTLNARLTLQQVVARTGGRTSFRFGGQFLSNPVNVGVSYQTVYAPFRPGNPFVQAMGVDVRVRLPGNLQIQGGTYTMPDGALRYTVSGSHFFTRARNGAGSVTAAKFAKYLIRGRVLDKERQPVAGAVIQIGSEVLITDETGQFFIRTESAAPMKLTIVTDEFLAHGHFSAVSAPSQLTRALERHAQEIVIVVSRK